MKHPDKTKLTVSSSFVQEHKLYPVATTMSGKAWAQWFGFAAELIPELSRAMQFIEDLCVIAEEFSKVDATLAKFITHMQDPDDLSPIPVVGLADWEDKARPWVGVINKYMGSGRCPSSAGCERLAIRCRVLQGWVESIEQTSNQLSLTKGQGTSFQLGVLWVAGLALQRFFVLSEGADDKHGWLTKSLREFAKCWMQKVLQAKDQGFISGESLPSWLYPVAMADQTTVVEPKWWWQGLAKADRATLMKMLEEDVQQLTETQAGAGLSWKTLDKRWRRMRMKGLLQHLNDCRVLAELLKRSAVDDFEAAEAVRALQTCGRGREAMAFAERWLRALPKSPVLAEALFDVYIKDGWNEEARALAQQQFAHDPNPTWTDRIRQIGLS